MTALARAAKSGHVDIVQLLLEHGARVGDKAHVSTKYTTTLLYSLHSLFTRSFRLRYMCLSLCNTVFYKYPFNWIWMSRLFETLRFAKSLLA